MIETGSDQNGAVRLAKAELRARVRGAVNSMSLEERREASVKLSELLERQESWHEAKGILFYSATAGEPELSRLLKDALASKKAVALPRFDKEGGIYAGALIESPADLEIGRYGILEPGRHCAVVPLKRLDFILTPGVAFDLNGHRLGRGKGYYDRLLAEFEGWKCGVAFDQQVVEAVPDEPHDIRLTCLVTPTRWQFFTKPRAVLK